MQQGQEEIAGRHTHTLQLLEVVKQMMGPTVGEIKVIHVKMGFNGGLGRAMQAHVGSSL